MCQQVGLSKIATSAVNRVAQTPHKSVCYIQVKSAAAIAALELRPGDNEKKNKILVPVPHPSYNR